MPLPATPRHGLCYAYSARRITTREPDLEKIRAKLLAINFADDEINPPELRTYDREMPRVKNGRFIIVPASDKTTGHSTTGHPEFCKSRAIAGIIGP